MKVKIINTAAGPDRVVLAGTVLIVGDESELEGLDYELLEPVVRAKADAGKGGKKPDEGGGKK